MKFFTIQQANKLGADLQLLTWMRDDSAGVELVKKFHKQVSLNEGRVSCPVRNGGLVSLFVNNIIK
jgi:hypothetical protein